MATCRVYLCTYRRNDLLPRALNSLLGQTFTDWVCELHNDDPADPFPRQLVERLADPRVIMVDHAKNLGPTRTFNLVYKTVTEQYVSLLEDDNWWEPTFLETMVGVMRQHPEAHIAWANMKLWRQEVDGSWTNTGECVWERSSAGGIEVFARPHRRQIMGALHSNGAALLRSANLPSYVIPNETPFAIVEPVRERCFDLPLLLIPNPLANFAVTQETARSKQSSDWGQAQALLAASFFKHIPVTDETLRALWAEARRRPARSTSALFFAAVINPKGARILRHATAGDWAFYAASCLRHPLTSFRIMKAKRDHPRLWDFLDQQTASWLTRARLHGFESL